MSVQAENSRKCSFLSSLGYNGSLVIWTVVCLTATKFKPLVLSVPAFALSNIANIYIFVVLYDFCLATGDVFDFINNSHSTDPKENATAA
jgi:hypothetical protein